jgi:moderate conductance mechanosensitive channel
MLSWLTTFSEVLLLVPVAFALSWVARTVIRTLTRRAVRRAQRAEGSWRVRLDRLGDNGQADARKRQRADSVAKMIGRFVTVMIFTVTTFVALEAMGVNLALVISSAGFIGLALALSGQDLVKDFLAGTRALMEDRYAVGDDVVLRVGGSEVRGVVDLIGSASVRLRTPEGATWHAGHHAVESVTNLSQLPSVSDIEVPLEQWAAADELQAAERLVEASNDVGLTGVVFLRDIETHEPVTATDEPADTVTVRVRTNRPLSSPETAIVRARLLDR